MARFLSNLIGIMRYTNVQIGQATTEQLQQWETELSAQYDQFKAQALSLDLTRGKPSAQQLSLSDALDGILQGNYKTADGTDVRNYGGLVGIPETRRMGAELLGVTPEEIIVGGNGSLTLMYQCVQFARQFGPGGPGSAWQDEGPVKFLCPVPGYDRHFAICAELGIEMVNVDMTDSGPDMDQVENLIANDSSIKGIWCVPKYSNPTGIVYSDETVQRIAKLGQVASANFRVFWDNAYTVHDLTDNPPQLANVMDYCREYGTEDSVLQFASTSKITFAGAGICFLAASEANLTQFKKHLGIATIGPDKVNQLRHARLFPNHAALKNHMRGHAELVRPKFELVLRHLRDGLGDSGMGDWAEPEGGYFVSFDTRDGLASEIVHMAKDIGVKLTPAGATFPYEKDPRDRNIRLAPTLPDSAELDVAMQVFVVCVKLASVRQQLDAG